MNRYNLHIILFTLLWLSTFISSPLMAQKHKERGPYGDRRTYSLGSGGSQYSGKNHPDRRTGLYRTANVGVHHFLGIWQDDAYSTFFHDVPTVSSTPGGGAAGLGLCYEYQVDRLRLQVGLGLRFQDVRYHVADTTFVRDYVHDSQGYRYNLRYDFRNRVDRSRNIYAQLPIMLGYGFYGCYLMVGAKLNYSFAGNTCVLDTGVTTGTYNQYLGHYVEMDNHGLRKDVPYFKDRMPELQLKFDVLLSTEFGYEWVQTKQIDHRRSKFTRENRYRIAAFADYGLLNINPNTRYSYLYIPEGPYQWDFPLYERNHVFSTSLTEGKQLHNFFAGIRFTVLLGFVVEYKCVLCTPFLSEADFNN